MRWNPCATLHWKAYLAHAPAGGFDALQKSVYSVATITQTHWQYDGATGTPPTTNALPGQPNENKPIILGWDSPNNSMIKAAGPNTAGVAAGDWFSLTGRNGNEEGVRQGGVVALNDAGRLPMTGAGSWTEIILHELAHVMGSAHVQNTAELMDPAPSPNLASLQTGDRDGLHLLGRQAGCLD
ncbi:MAG: hypothetical protein NVS3B1_06010 [Marmoricola sp.]